MPITTYVDIPKLGRTAMRVDRESFDNARLRSPRQQHETGFWIKSSAGARCQGPCWTRRAVVRVVNERGETGERGLVVTPPPPLFVGPVD